MNTVIDPRDRFRKGFVLGPILAALFMTVLAIYSRVFADWLHPDQQGEDQAAQ